MPDAPKQPALDRRERVIIVATDLTNKTIVLTPREHPGVSDEDYLNGLRTEMKTYFTDMHYAREAVTYEPLTDTGTPTGYVAGDTAETAPAVGATGAAATDTPVETLIQFPAEWAR